MWRRISGEKSLYAASRAAWGGTVGRGGVKLGKKWGVVIALTQ